MVRVGTPEVAHRRQSADAAVVASVTTHTIGAAERAGPCGAEDGGTGSAPNAPAAVHHMRAELPGASAATTAAHYPRRGCQTSAGGFSPNVIPFADRLARGAIAPEAPRTRLGAANTQRACLANCGARRPPSLLFVAGAVIFDLWPVWAVAALGILLAGQA